jgi:hypothetical protein
MSSCVNRTAAVWHRLALSHRFRAYHSLPNNYWLLNTLRPIWPGFFPTAGPKEVQIKTPAERAVERPSLEHAAGPPKPNCSLLRAFPQNRDVNRYTPSAAALPLRKSASNSFPERNLWLNPFPRGFCIGTRRATEITYLTNDDHLIQTRRCRDRTAERRKPGYDSSVPFRNLNDLRQHFSDHQAEFVGIVTEVDYLARAEAFLNGPKSPTALECLRPQGGMARYDSVTQEYGSIRRDGTIATYFIPNPATHGLPSNLDYYHEHCK